MLGINRLHCHAGLRQRLQRQGVNIIHAAEYVSDTEAGAAPATLGGLIHKQLDEVALPLHRQRERRGYPLRRVRQEPVLPGCAKQVALRRYAFPG